MRFRRVGQLLVVAVAAVPLAACGGSSGTAVSAGNGTPGAAAVGFLADFTNHNKAACNYVTPSQQTVCNQAIGQTTGLSVGNLKVGKTTIVNDKALVTVLGKLCGPGTNTNKPSCFTSSDPNAGQPSSKADFAKTYQGVLAGTAGTKNPAIPCVLVGGKWYVDLGGGA